MIAPGAGRASQGTLGSYSDIADVSPGSPCWRLASTALLHLQRQDCHDRSNSACSAIRGASLVAIERAQTQVVAGLNYKIKCNVGGGHILDVRIFEQQWTRTLELLAASISYHGKNLGPIIKKIGGDLSGSAEQYASVELSVPGLSASFFLPPIIESDGARRKQPQSYYRSSRFDWGTMVGDVLLRATDGSTHTLFDSSVWRWPHDPTWTESGVGLAAEFGCGEDGDVCNEGWGAEGLSSNGVLGYSEAGAGGSFLKLGVGALRKGSCPGCNGTDAGDLYRFNRPYRHVTAPEWRLVEANSTRNMAWF